jgi:hypothetical protein
VTWYDAGMFDQLHRLLLAQLHHADQLDWSRAVIDGSHIQTLNGGTRRAQARSTAHGQEASTTRSATPRGVPLTVSLTGGNAHDITQLLPLFDAIPAVGGKRGRPSRRPMLLLADRGDDFDRYRRALWARESVRSSLAADTCTAPGLGASAGWWSDRSPGCISPSGCGYVGKHRPTSMRHF